MGERQSNRELLGFEILIDFGKQLTGLNLTTSSVSTAHFEWILGRPMDLRFRFCPLVLLFRLSSSLSCDPVFGLVFSVSHLAFSAFPSLSFSASISISDSKSSLLTIPFSVSSLLTLSSQPLWLSSLSNPNFPISISISDSKSPLLTLLSTLSSSQHSHDLSCPYHSLLLVTPGPILFLPPSHDLLRFRLGSK